MNKEAYPLLLLLLGAFAFVSLVVCYIKGWFVGIFTFFQELDTLYYIIIFPMGIGFFACILKYRHG